VPNAAAIRKARQRMGVEFIVASYIPIRKPLTIVWARNLS
jgi:hypothetical protein